MYTYIDTCMLVCYMHRYIYARTHTYIDTCIYAYMYNNLIPTWSIYKYNTESVHTAH